MRAFVKLATLLSWIAFSPSLAHAQASITGTVKDPTGAVLPGVAVEAASPVLIERVRVATTDGTGQYRIVDLRPGTYTATFTLVGFNTAAVSIVLLAMPATAVDSGPTVAVAGGRIRGAILEEGGAVFKGIPFAQPPVEALRNPAAVRSGPGAITCRTVEC